MRTYSILCFVLAIAMVVTPLFAFRAEVLFPKEAQAEILESEDETARASDTVKIKSAASGSITTETEFDYLVGAVAAEMPLTYHEEALKAQAVACNTLLQRLRLHPDAGLDGADISDSPAVHQGYLSAAQQRDKWGDRYDAYRQKAEKAVRAVLGQTVQYGGEPILAAFCAISPGSTESAAYIWGGDIPYLQSVQSPGDRLSPDFSSALSVPAADFQKKLQSKGVSLSGAPEAWLGECKRSEAGTVTALTVGGKTFTGTEIRSLFSLRSPAFRLEFKNGGFLFSVSGYGHGVGMSQYGADYMARQGLSYKEILEHYYTGAKVV